MAPDTSYDEVLTRNIRAARSRLDLEQKNIVARMRALGHDTWHRQTMGKVERGERRVTGEEMIALALALETTIAALMAPRDEDGAVELRSGARLPVEVVRLSAVGKIVDGAVRWDGDEPVFSAQEHPPVVVDVMNRMAEGTWPPRSEG
jgi:transcriptional regulator with XRE-family HTH domain